MDIYEKERENVRNNIYYGSYAFIDEGSEQLTKKLYEQVEFELFVKQPPKEQKESRKQIEKMKQDIVNGDKFPAVALIRHPHYDYVIDGKHRVMAFYELRVKNIPVIWLKR